ncbi:MAG: hypothetical protein K0U61_01595 [Alphaproteobacteria bacterium]|nr:hypothetical protein [Alphaproteobacteria bacterium]
MTTRDRLLADIESFLRATGMSHTKFGKLVANDTALITELRAGRDIRLGTADKIRDYMASALKSKCENSPGTPGETATL